MLKVGVDCETTGLNKWRGHAPFSVAFHFSDDTSYFEEWDVDPFTRRVHPKKSQIKRINEITQDPNIEKDLFNGKFDIGMLETIGVKFDGPIHDVMIMFKCLRSDEWAGLKRVAKTYLDIDDDDEKALHLALMRARREAKAKGWNIATAISHPEGGAKGSPSKADYWLVRDFNKPYNMRDAYRTIVGREFFYPLMEKEKVLKTYLEEMEVFWKIKAMEDKGIRVFRNRVVKQLKTSNLALKKSTKILFREAGEKFNPNSRPQITNVLRGLNLKSEGVTKNGNVSVAMKWIQHLDHPFIKALATYTAHKDAANMFKSYMRNMVKEGDLWIIHPSFKQIGARTHRMSSENPNLQNVRNKESGKSKIAIEVRSVFGPRPGYRWESNDHDQEEVWIFAADSGELYMLKVLKSGGDIHAENAKAAWPKEYAKDPTKIRKRAKGITFCLAYGGGPRALMVTLGCTYQEAVEYIDAYLSRFTGIRPYQRRLMNRALRKGYIRTFFGRKLMVPSAFAYKAVDYRIQGTGADVIKRDILNVSNFFTRNKIDAYPVLPIHDDLINEVSLKVASPSLSRKVHRIMENHDGRIPNIDKLPVSLKIYEKDWASEKQMIYLGK